MNIHYHSFPSDTLVRIDSINSVDEFKGILDDICHFYGFDGYSFYHYNSVEQSYFKIDTRPEAYLHIYEEIGGIYIDPIAYLTTLRPRTFRWTEGLSQISLSPIQNAQLEIARKFGIKDGISSSVISEKPYISAISWYSDSYTLVSDVFQKSGHILDTITKAIVQKYEYFLCDIEIPSLTPRERDVLSWVARGKTSIDVSEILDISAHTVDSHLRAILLKLNAPSRSNAVAKAITYRIITL